MQCLLFIKCKGEGVATVSDDLSIVLEVLSGQDGPQLCPSLVIAIESRKLPTLKRGFTASDW